MCGWFFGAQFGDNGVLDNNSELNVNLYQSPTSSFLAVSPKFLKGGYDYINIFVS